MSRRQLTNREIREKLAKAERKALCDDPKFVRLLLTISDNAGINSPAFHRGDPYSTAFDAGRQSLGMELFELLAEACPDVRVRVEQERLRQRSDPPIVRTDQDDGHDDPDE